MLNEDRYVVRDRDGHMWCSAALDRVPQTSDDLECSHAMPKGTRNTDLAMTKRVAMAVLKLCRERISGRYGFGPYALMRLTGKPKPKPPRELFTCGITDDVGDLVAFPSYERAESACMGAQRVVRYVLAEDVP